MFRCFYIFLIALCFVPISTWATNGYIGENPGFDLYNQIDDSVDSVSAGLTTTRVKQYATFQGFGSNCRKPISGFDQTPMNEKLLQDIIAGNYGGLSMLLTQNHINMDSVSFMNLVGCFSDTYNKMQQYSTKEESSLSHVGNIGLYTDGDTSNSDYDIIADIQKINSIIFSERYTYVGTKNMGKTSLNNLLSGKPVASLFGNAPTSNVV